ncbi:uncharacterized protein LOC132460961 isoform X14 [Gadus macrocephalus]|uniref:uncharacterized protein LOC132460961 isoform X14 n=1 Tax=Gadus macrocephalus TaxID=80720 RepID=UPI0028CB4F2D|nr:uncharacterized protein LOC132460961 isoform X14 [Gadus macrocephalus]
MSPCGPTLEEQLSSIMDVLAKGAVSEISQLFLEGSATIRLQLTRSMKENQALRRRMKVMKSKMFSLRLQTRSYASCAARHFALARAIVCKPQTKPLGNEDCDDCGDRSTQRGAPSDGLHVDAPGSSHMSSHSEELRILSVHGKGEGPLALHSHDDLFTASEPEALSSLSTEHGVVKSLERGEQLVPREELTGQQQTPDTILIKDEEDIGGGMPAVEDCDDFGDRRTQRDTTSESLYAPGSSHISSHSEKLRILSVHGKGEGPLVLDGHDTLFTASRREALNSLSADLNVVKSLERGEQLVHREELTVQQTPDTILTKDEEDIGGGMPAVEHCDVFGNRSTPRDTTSESLYAPGSSHMSSHSEELRILSVYGKGEGPLALDGYDTLFTASKREAKNSLSADHSVDKGLECGEQLVRHEELTVQQQTTDTILIKDEEDIGGGMPAVEDCVDFGDCSTQHDATLNSLHVDASGSSHMSSHNGELRILSVYGKGEEPLAVDGHDNLFTAFEPEALSLLSAERSVAKSLERGEQLVHREELTGHRGSGKDRPGVLSVEGFPENTNMTIHMRTHTGEKPYGCDQCTKRFQMKGSLKIHLRTHSGEKPYSCEQCVKRFNQSSDLKVHMWTHSREKPYRCDQCVKSFTKSSNLKIHMRTHSGEKPYRCDQCMKSFGRCSSLKCHMRTHSREKPYRCDHCVRCFSHSSDLKIHMKTHSGEKRYRCDQCMKCFGQSSHLKNHMRIHSGEKPYRCDQCVKSFSQSSSLKSHLRTHSGEKPYRCNQCVKRFSHSSDLKIHMRTHSGEKPYRCDQCMKCFGQSSHLKSHMRTHSGEKP